MTRINLLPWREKLREERKKAFLITLGIVVGIAGVILFVGDRIVNSGISAQSARNSYLKEQIAGLDRELAEIRALREQKEALTERMAVIQDLQGTRPIIVRLFDELVRTLPEGVYYQLVRRTDNSITLEGVAESNSRVSALMRSLDDSEWFADPDLRGVSAVPSSDAQGIQQNGRNQFELTVNVTTPTLPGAE